MDTPEVTAYLKTYCGWSAGVRAVLAKYNLPYTEKDIIQNPAFRWEMETKSGQPLSPCIEINGQMLANVSGASSEAELTQRYAAAAARVGRSRGRSGRGALEGQTRRPARRSRWTASRP